MQKQNKKFKKKQILLSKKMAGPVQIEMERKLRQAFEPTHLEVVNESYKHCVPKDSETHFKVKLLL
jgi:BolA protein